jgi:putative Mg2+ transporter-C (MgtC) family protein
VSQEELLQQLLSIEPFHWGSIGTAILCGFIIGLERQLRGKPVGIRTSALIVTGTYLFVATALSLDSAQLDPTRIIGQVVTGVGFLGAGVMMTRDGTVLGVTSAATIWMLAALGICIAAIGNLVSIKLALVVLGILYGVEALEHTSSKLTRGVHAHYIYWRRAARRSWSDPAPQHKPPATGKEQGDG